MRDSTRKNVRMRGKIRREEWPKIAERFRKGETLTEIARSYQCTAPAIRYIVSRVSARDARGDMDRNEPVAFAAPTAAVTRRAITQALSVEGRDSPADPSTAETWDRISSDIASFLAGIDALSVDDSDENYQALLLATDRLLRASARTRLEVERVLDSRKGSRKKGATQR